MNFNEANNILKRIKREFKAFEDMEALIQFCVDLEHTKGALKDEIALLEAARHEAEEKFDQAKFRLGSVQGSLAKAQADHEERMLSLDAAFEEHIRIQNEAYDQAEVEGDKRLKAVQDAIAVAERLLDQLLRKCDTAAADYDDLVAKYEEFKRNL